MLRDNELSLLLQALQWVCTCRRCSSSSSRRATHVATSALSAASKQMLCRTPASAELQTGSILERPSIACTSTVADYAMHVCTAGDRDHSKAHQFLRCLLKARTLPMV